MDEEGPQRLRHLHCHKDQDRNVWEETRESEASNCKADPLISHFRGHLKIEQKSIHLLCSLKLFKQTH